MEFGKSSTRTHVDPVAREETDGHVTDALGNNARQAYNDRGQVAHVWGGAVKPVSYVYDDFGRLAEMRTYRGGTRSAFGTLQREIKTKECSATTAVCCWAGGGHKILEDGSIEFKPAKIINPHDTIPNRTTPPHGKTTLAAGELRALNDFKAGVAHAQSICKKGCCKTVTVKLTCHFGTSVFDRMSMAEGKCGKEKVVKCSKF